MTELELNLSHYLCKRVVNNRYLKFKKTREVPSKLTTIS